MTSSESRANYAATLGAVINDREEVVITRAGREPVVIVALDEYESLKETGLPPSQPRERATIVRFDRRA